MKKLIYILPLLLYGSHINTKGFNSGLAYGSFFGFTTGMLASEMRRYHHETRPSMYIYAKPQPAVYVVPQPTQSQIVYYPSQPLTQTTEGCTSKDTCEECKAEYKKLELEILKEENRKKELTLKEKNLDAQILTLKQI